jgi:hypothetical protein
MIHPTLADGESFVEGRSGATAKALLEAAGDRGLEVKTTSFGYILPTDLVPEGVSAVTNADTAAVITEPGTSKNESDVWNVGGARTAPADQDDDLSEDPNRVPGMVSDTVTESSDDKDVDPDVLAALEAEKQAASEAEADKNAEEARAAAEAAAADADENPEGREFDPTAVTIAEVKTYLDGADDVERARVIDAEKASAKPRTGVLELATVPEGDK